MQVQVGHRLLSSFSARQEQRCAIGPEVPLKALGDGTSERSDRRPVRGGDIAQRHGVAPRDHQGVSRSQRADRQEGDRSTVLAHPGRRGVTSNDGAEDAAVRNGRCGRAPGSAGGAAGTARGAPIWSRVRRVEGLIGRRTAQTPGLVRGAHRAPGNRPPGPRTGPTALLRKEARLGDRADRVGDSAAACGGDRFSPVKPPFQGRDHRREIVPEREVSTPDRSRSCFDRRRAKTMSATSAAYRSVLPSPANAVRMGGWGIGRATWALQIPQRRHVACPYGCWRSSTPAELEATRSERTGRSIPAASRIGQM